MPVNPLSENVRKREVVQFECVESEEEANVKRVEAIDRLHETPSDGHGLMEERNVTGGVAMIRKVCQCGWQGPWFRDLHA